MRVIPVLQKSETSTVMPEASLILRSCRPCVPIALTRLGACGEVAALCLEVGRGLWTKTP